MDFDKKVRLRDEITTTTQKDFIDGLYNLVKTQCQLTPVIIVAGQTYSSIQNNLTKCEDVKFNFLRGLKPNIIDSLLDTRFI